MGKNKNTENSLLSSSQPSLPLSTTPQSTQNLRSSLHVIGGSAPGHLLRPGLAARVRRQAIGDGDKLLRRSVKLKISIAIRSMSYGVYGTVSLQTRALSAFVKLPNGLSIEFGEKNRQNLCHMRVTMRDRSKNRKPLQKGRNLSIEAIQTIQALKRTLKSTNKQQEIINSKFSRLLKFDMMAILRELLRQDLSHLALMVFEEIQKEHWYKPEVSLYAEIILVLARNELYEKVEMIFLELKTEKGRLVAKTEGFNVLLETLLSYNMIELTMDCFELMKEVGYEPDRLTFKSLVSYLESKGETSLSQSIRQEAHKYYGDSLEFIDEQQEMAMK